ncbi:MAG: site-specific integrase, partial [Chloroflexi bacterium]
AEIERLLAQTAIIRLGDKPDARPDLLLRLLLDTAIKKSECMELTPEHILRDDPAHPVLLIRHKKPGNVYRERKITLDPSWLDVFDEYQEQYRVTDTIFDCTARNLEYILHDVATAAGVEGKVSFEILRWTSAVRDYRRGADLEELREKMGLSRISWRETSDKIIRLAALQHSRV